MATSTSDPTATYLVAVASGDADAVRDLFVGEPLIEDPRHERREAPTKADVAVEDGA